MRRKSSSKDVNTLPVARVVESSLADLRRMADPARAVAMGRFFHEPMLALGVDASTLRSLARSWIRQVRGSWTITEAIAFCERLLACRHQEERALGFLVLAGFRRQFEPSLFRRARPWVERFLDNWALVDGFAAEVLSPLVRRYPELADNLPEWSRSDCLWTRRSALVTLVPLARRGEQLDLVYSLAEGALNAREDLMHKALGWLLREAGRTDRDRLETFLLRHRAAVPRTSIRYALEHFPADRRAALMTATRNDG